MVFEPVQARYIRLVALSATGNAACASEIILESPQMLGGAQTPESKAREIPRSRMKATATSQHAPSFGAAMTIDGKAATFWECERGSLNNSPQSVTLELDGLYTVDALHYVHPPGRGRIETYRIQFSRDGQTYNDVMQPDKAGEIIVDAAQKRIGTVKPDSANLTLQTFTDTPLIYSWKNWLDATAPSGKVCMIDATAQTQRETLAVTAIFPRRAMSDDLRELKRLADDTSEGFTTTAPNGAVVRCQAARKDLSTLKCDKVTAQAELLVTVEKDGQFSGLVLGCMTLNKADKKVTITSRDFVFDIKKDDPPSAKSEFIPILSAINPVEILPARNVFCDNETITLVCPTPDMEIRYTLDSSEPLRSSQLYTKPFSIRESTRIRARAFRNGRQEPVDTMDFTLDSAENSAFYERQTLLPPLAESTNPNTGLRYQYYEGNWQQLYLNPALAEPAATGSVAALFDLMPRKTDGTFAFLYDGFLEVPKDGVYTFHAPLELIDNRLIDSGYDLVLYVGDRRWQPAMRRHAFGSWSVALKKGLHSFRLKYLDYRGNLVVGYNAKGERQEVKIDHATWQKQFGYIDMIRPLDTARRACDFVWVGPPRLELSGPGLERGQIPAGWFRHQ